MALVIFLPNVFLGILLQRRCYTGHGMGSKCLFIVAMVCITVGSFQARVWLVYKEGYASLINHLLEAAGPSLRVALAVVVPPMVDGIQSIALIATGLQTEPKAPSIDKEPLLSKPLSTQSAPVRVTAGDAVDRDLGPRPAPALAIATGANATSDEKFDCESENMIIFSVVADVEFGESVCVLGSVEALGNWTPGKGLVMHLEQGSSTHWSAATKIDVCGEACSLSDVEYKFVKLSTGGDVEWEPGGPSTNRIISSASPRNDAPWAKFGDMHISGSRRASQGRTGA